jgi:O-antigen/teichoic acid export membrane protein
MSDKKSFLFHLKNHVGVAIVSKLTPLFAIFIYTRFMSPEDYGILNLYNSYLGLLGILLVLNMHTAIGRYIYFKDIDYSKFISMTLIVVFIIAVLVFIVFVISINSIAVLISLPINVIILMFFIAFGSILESLFSQIAIYKEKSALLFKIVGIKALATVLLSIMLLFVIDKSKYLAIIWADLIIYLLLSVYILKSLWEYIRIVYDKEYLRLMAIYSLPLIPYMLSLSLLSQSDRILINYYYGKSETGLYSLAYNVGILLVMLVSAILNTINPSFYRNLNDKNYGKVLDDSNAIFYIAVFSTLIIILFGSDLISLIVSSKYKNSFDLIPIVALGGLCSTLFQIWIRTFAYINKTYIISLISVGVTIINVSLNVFLLPLYGYKIAAITTFLSYLLMSIISMLVSNKYVGLYKINIFRTLLYIVILSIIYILFEQVNIYYLTYPIKFVVVILFFFHLKSKVTCLKNYV